MIKFEQTSPDKVAIVVVGYNRLHGIVRLLKSLENAIYPDTDIPLIFSIDCSGNEDLYQFVRDYKWNHGPKFVNIENSRLGLKKHIFQCGGLTEYFKAIILLEDDLIVSPQFYRYTLSALDKYGDDANIAQIALYRNEMNGYVGFPFEPECTGYDTLKIQATCSWGECWNKRMWDEFMSYLPNITNESISECDMPHQIKGWTRAWSKYFYTYIIENNKFVIYPTNSVTTNFNDAGGEHGSSGNFVQVSLLTQNIDFRMPNQAELTTYDVYYNNLKIYNILGIPQNDLCLDIYGFNDRIRGQRYLLSTRELPYKVVRSFGLEMRPIEANIFHGIEGNGIYLYDTSVSSKGATGNYTKYLTNYFLKGFDFKSMAKETLRILFAKIQRRLHVSK